MIMKVVKTRKSLKVKLIVNKKNKKKGKEKEKRKHL